MNDTTITILLTFVFAITSPSLLCQCTSPQTTETQEVVSEVIPWTWLKAKTTIKESEEKHMISNDQLGDEPVPFGFQNDKWLEFKALTKEGDEIWEFASPTETWNAMAGRAGICLVREGHIIATIITMMN